MKKELAEEILQLIDEFSVPLTNLSEALNKIEEPEERKKLRRILGEIMGKLDGEIAYPLRIEFSVGNND